MGKSLALVGGGPAALMVYKRLVEGHMGLEVHIFESSQKLGSGMPYSSQGAGLEHVTNVSGDELPDLVVPLTDWIKSLNKDVLDNYGVDPQSFHKKKVIPRLLFGEYLSNQFATLIEMGDARGFETVLHMQTRVLDISNTTHNKVIIESDQGESLEFDQVVICSGHHWPGSHEGKVSGYFDSPYPPAKLAQSFDHKVAIQGSSLTAIDAIRTMARNSGTFVCKDGKLTWEPAPDATNFGIEMHSRHGLLPCVRVHMEEPHGAQQILISEEELNQNMAQNDGFLSLDFVFAKGFIEPLQESDPELYAIVKDMALEDFVQSMMTFREKIEPFELLTKEYLEAKNSIENHEPVYWKEMLSALSFAMNYPAKHLCAEDMLRLQKILMPLISVVIAFVPQSSCEELLALHRANRVKLIGDDEDARVEIKGDNEIVYHYTKNGKNVDEKFSTFVDCTGQPHLSIGDFPFASLLKDGTVSPARLKFKSKASGEALMAQKQKHVYEHDGHYYLEVPGANISDDFQLVGTDGRPSESIYLMAVPYMGGFNPDYSGLDFCERASVLIVDHLMR